MCEYCVAHKRCSGYKEWQIRQSWKLTKEQQESLEIVEQAYKNIKRGIDIQL